MLQFLTKIFIDKNDNFIIRNFDIKLNFIAINLITTFSKYFNKSQFENITKIYKFSYYLQRLTTKFKFFNSNFLIRLLIFYNS